MLLIELAILCYMTVTGFFYGRFWENYDGNSPLKAYSVYLILALLWPVTVAWVYWNIYRGK